MGRQESPQLIERKGQVDTDAQETNRASKYFLAYFMRILNACEVLQDSIMQTGVCASRSIQTLSMLDCSYSTRPAQPHFAAVNCSDAMMGVFYSLF